MAQEKTLLTINATDLQGDCYRLNRRFALLEEQVANLRTAMAEVSASGASGADAQTAAGNPLNPVNPENLNIPPGKAAAPVSASPAIAYGPRSLRLSDYVPSYHVGELFIETGATLAIYQSQIVDGEAKWVLVQ